MLGLVGRMGRAPLATLLLVVGCTLDISGLGNQCIVDSECEAGQSCIDGVCRDDVDSGTTMDAGPSDAGPAIDGPSVDAGPVEDAGGDAGADDAGPPPAHCSDTIRNMGETDIDCGGACPGCSLCEICLNAGDCANGSCRDGLCREELQMVTTDVSMTSRPAYVRDDGAILLAYYEPTAVHTGYRIDTAQIVASAGGSNAPPGWAPDPCTQSGHLPFAEFVPAGRAVTMECGPDSSAIQYRATSSTIFTDFSEGTRLYPASGDPGWGVIASLGSGSGRGSHAMCGQTETPLLGGIAYCDGSTPGRYDDHVVSYSISSTGVNYVGCGRTGCSGSTCETSIWVWLEP